MNEKKIAFYATYFEFKLEDYNLRIVIRSEYIYEMHAVEDARFYECVSIHPRIKFTSNKI